MERIGQCHCGSLRVIATGEPDRVYLCHCKACQRRTGTAFHFGATYKKEQVRLDGERKIYERDADSGYRIRFHFCPNCGSTVYWEGDRNPAVCGVAVGQFDTSAFQPPSDSIWEESMYPWLGLPPRMEHHRQGSATGHMTQETMRKTPDLHHPQAKHLGSVAIRVPEKFIEHLMTKWILSAALVAAGTGVYGTSIAAAADLSVRKSPGTDHIENVVVIYAENRSFDNLYGFFPGANGLQHLTGKIAPQRDRDGLVLKELPPIWDGLTAKGVTPTVTEAQTQHLPNRPFAIDDPNGFNLFLDVATRDLLNLFYQNQVQINRGKNDKFVAYGNSGALVMGHYKNGDKLPLWQIARQYTLADNFFMGAFGGSFLNHFWLVCACTPRYPNADQSPATGQIAVLESDGVSLKLAEDSPKSAMEGTPKYVRDGTLTPDFYAINTMQPPPAERKQASGG